MGFSSIGRKDNRGRREITKQHPLDVLFWETYNSLKRPDGTISEAVLKWALVSTGKVAERAAVDIIEDIINENGLKRVGYDTLKKHDYCLR